MKRPSTLLLAFCAFVAMGLLFTPGISNAIPAGGTQPVWFIGDASNALPGAADGGDYTLGLTNSAGLTPGYLVLYESGTSSSSTANWSDIVYIHFASGDWHATLYSDPGPEDPIAFTITPDIIAAAQAGISNPSGDSTHPGPTQFVQENPNGGPTAYFPDAGQPGGYHFGGGSQFFIYSDADTVPDTNGTVPEPSTFLLVGTGLVVVSVFARSRVSNIS
jgi:hypothetical protein